MLNYKEELYMKPTLVFYEKNKDGKIVLSEDEVRALVEDAYERGFEDGKKTIPQQPKKINVPTFKTLRTTY